MSERRTKKFVRALLNGDTARLGEGGLYRVVTPSGVASLEETTVRNLIADGLFEGTSKGCKATPLCRKWLLRNMSEAGGPAMQNRQIMQHRQMKRGTGDLSINLCESPLARLAIARNGAPAFLAHHHLQAGEKIRRLVDQAQMMQRTTMSYDPNRLPSPRGSGNSGSDLGEQAIDARSRLRAVMDNLPADCACVVMDVCGYLKGLQLIETERRWPRRSAKLLLRVGLEQLAVEFGFSEIATGVAARKNYNWLDPNARPGGYEPS